MGYLNDEEENPQINTIVSLLSLIYALIYRGAYNRGLQSRLDQEVREPLMDTHYTESQAGRDNALKCSSQSNRERLLRIINIIDLIRQESSF